MAKRGLVSLVFWCLFVLYVIMSTHSGFRLLVIFGIIGDSASFGWPTYTDLFSQFAGITSRIFHFTMATVMVVFSILFYKGSKFAHRVVLITPWAVVVFTILMWLAGQLYRLAQGEAFFPTNTNEIYIGFLLFGLLQMFMVAIANSWVVTSESVIGWIESEDAELEGISREKRPGG